MIDTSDYWRILPFFNMEAETDEDGNVVFNLVLNEDLVVEYLGADSLDELRAIYFKNFGE